jgi:Mn2+/Fe2+ NRAMP family transporter
MAPKKKKSETNNTDNTTNIAPGMEVEASQGDLGEEDVSKPKVTGVVKDQQGNVDKLIVQKGVIFKKTLEIPADRVQSIDQENIADESTSGKVIVDVGKKEAESLTATGVEELESEQQHNLLDMVEQEVPTAEALRELEASDKDVQAKSQQASARDEGLPTSPGKKNILLHVLGPGFLAGMAGNDASAVATYAVDGAATGYGHLWLLLLSTPLYQAVQYACAKVGRITQKGFAEILREHYSRWVAIPASLILIVANIALIAADLVAIGSGLELITGFSWIWFVIPVGVILWYLTIYRSFETIKKIFIIISTASTLFTHHQSITTAADAARALEPLLGPFAKYLFAIGLIGAGLVAIPVLLASTSYAVAGTFGWPAGLSKKPWQNEGFYLILTGALVLSLVLALLRLDPIKLIFEANVLSGVLAPILVVYLIMIGNNRMIMRKQRLGFLTNIGLVVTALVMFTAAILLFYGLLTGHGRELSPQ